MRTGIVTGLGEMYLVADPRGLALGRKAGLGFIGRGDQPRMGRQVVAGTPAHVVWADILLEPDVSQDLDGGALTQIRRRIRRVDRLQQGIAILADSGFPHPPVGGILG